MRIQGTFKDTIGRLPAGHGSLSCVYFHSCQTNFAMPLQKMYVIRIAFPESLVKHSAPDLLFMCRAAGRKPLIRLVFQGLRLMSKKRNRQVSRTVTCRGPSI